MEAVGPAEGHVRAKLNDMQSSQFKLQNESIVLHSASLDVGKKKLNYSMLRGIIDESCSVCLSQENVVSNRPLSQTHSTRPAGNSAAVHCAPQHSDEQGLLAQADPIAAASMA